MLDERYPMFIKCNTLDRDHIYVADDLIGVGSRRGCHRNDRESIGMEEARIESMMFGCCLRLWMSGSE